MPGADAPSRRTAVVLFNLGGPDSPDAVEPFLRNLFSDRAIIGLPALARLPLARLIARRRARAAREIYAALGGASPLLPNTVAQAEALESVLRARMEGSARCFVAMRYWRPRADGVARAVRDWGADRVILLPLYPQFSTTTTGSSRDDWMRAARAAGLSVPARMVCCWPVASGFVQSVADAVADAVQRLPEGDRPRARILLSAHGLPQKVVDGGDPYRAQVEMTAAAVTARLRAMGLRQETRVCYQSRVGPLAWIKPYTEDEIRRAGQEKVPLAVAPVAFVSEHSETLVELDRDCRDLALACGAPSYARAAAAGVSPPFIHALADVVMEAAAMPGVDGAVASHGGARVCPAACGRCPMEEN